MTNVTIEKIKKNINRHNRRVRAENTVFEKMTKAERRVRLARDVIEHVAAKKITPRSGTWLGQGYNRRPLLHGEPIADDAQLKELLPRVEDCHACAVGSLLYCTVMRVNDLKVSQVRTAGSTLGINIADFGKIKVYLGKYFSENQLDMMEAAFEQKNEPDDQSKSVVAAGRMFMKRCWEKEVGAGYWEWVSRDEVSEETRLVVIMKNVIDNRGTFVPRRYDA